MSSSVADAVGTIRTILSLPAQWENVGGGIGAVFVPVPGRKGDESPREVLIGDVEGLLSYADGTAQTVPTWQVTGQYDQEHYHSEEVPASAGPAALAAAVARAFTAARHAR